MDSSLFVVTDMKWAFNQVLISRQFEDCLMESDVELGEVCLHPHIESILAAEQWVGDATGLVSHCLAILKICHRLTNHVAALAMDPVHQSKLQDIIQVNLQQTIKFVHTYLFSSRFIVSCKAKLMLSCYIITLVQ